MDREDALTTITTLVVGATSVGAFLPKLHEIDNGSMNVADLETLRMGEFFAIGLTMVAGLFAAFARKSAVPFVAASIFSFILMAVYEYKVGGYELP